MRTRLGWMVMLGLVGGLLPSPTDVPAAQQATPTDASAVVRVVAQQTVDLPGFRLLSMSPDGRWLLGLDDEQHRLCGIAIETLRPEGCADVRAAAFRGPVAYSVAWSPDGSRVAMTEDGLYRFYEPDIWTFEVETGRLVNLTDDGASEVLRPGPDGPPLLDLFPTWSPDGQAIAFARGVREDGEWAETGIFRIAATGGQPEKIASLPEPGAHAVYPELRWSSDGRFLAYSLMLPDRDDPNNGLWVVDADGANQRQVVTAEVERPLLVELSARGIAFVVAAGYLEHSQAHTGARFVAVDLTSSEERSLDTVPPPMWGAPLLPMLTFSPDGGRLLYVNVTRPSERRLLIHDLDRQETSTVLDPIDSWFGGAEPVGPVWGRNDHVFVPGPHGSAILLRLTGASVP